MQPLTTDLHAIFDSAFSGPTGEAVWIVDSPANRIWFEAAGASLDRDSALFHAARYGSTEEAFCFMIWGMIEHFPEWQRLHVSGLAPATPIPEELSDEGRWEIHPDGFVLHRV